MAREAHGGFKSLLASRLTPLSSKATHPPNYRSLHTACSAVVDDDVGGGVVVGANNVITCVAIIVTGTALVHVFPVRINTPFFESLLVAAALSSVFDDNVDGGVNVGFNAVIACVAIVETGAAVARVSPVTGNVPSAASVSLAAAVAFVVAVMPVEGDDVGCGVIVGAHKSPVATNT